MRGQTDTEEHFAPGVMPKVPWRVARVQALAGFRLAVEFVDGTAGEVDLSRLVTSERAGVFSALSDPESFATVFLDRGVVTWPGELDLAPDAMYDAIRANGRWLLDDE
jgi:hypothetical protein